MPAEVNWQGGLVKQYINSAVRTALNETVSRALEDASVLKKDGGRMPYYKGFLTRSLKWEGSGAATGLDGNVSVRWGSFDIGYAKEQEDKNGFLRGAADKEYPQFGARVKAQFKRIAPQNAAK